MLKYYLYLTKLLYFYQSFILDYYYSVMNGELKFISIYFMLEYIILNGNFDM